MTESQILLLLEIRDQAEGMHARVQQLTDRLDVTRLDARMATNEVLLRKIRHQLVKLERNIRSH